MQIREYNLREAVRALDEAARRLRGIASISDIASIDRVRNSVNSLIIDPNGPLTDDQRNALFAAFSDVFGGNDQEQRLAFTRLVLNKPGTAQVSWSRHKAGRLTAGEASKVLDALNLLNV